MRVKYLYLFDGQQIIINIYAIDRSSMPRRLLLPFFASFVMNLLLTPFFFFDHSVQFACKIKLVPEAADLSADIG